MRAVFAIVVVFALGCGASTPVPQYAGIKEKQHVEERELPPRPDAKPIPKDKDWVKPLPSAQCTIANPDGTTKTVKTEDGVLLSPEKAVRAKLWKTGYEGLRSLYDLDRKIWSQHRVVYEERLGQANKEIERRSPSWWDENKGTIAWASGFLIGAAATVAIVYAVDEVKDQ